MEEDTVEITITIRTREKTTTLHVPEAQGYKFGVDFKEEPEYPIHPSMTLMCWKREMKNINFSFKPLIVNGRYGMFKVVDNKQGE